MLVMKKHSLLFLVFIGCATPGFSQGINAFFMHDQPITEFSETDLELFKASVVNVLENKKDKETLNWENPETGTKGKIQLLESSSFHGNPCKTIKLQNSTENIDGSVYTYKACKQEDTWQVVPLVSD